MDDMSALGVGIIGTGWGVRVQVPAFRAGGLEVRALAGSNAAKTHSIAESLGVPFATGDWRELVARDDVALVSITTPPALHREIVLAALAAGKHVLCEKPTAMNAAEAQDMLEAARARPDRFALIDHELRFLPAYQRARELVASGAIGAVRHAYATIANGTRLDPQRPWSWWFDEAQGGGALGAIGSHAIDTLRFLVGEVVAATGYRQTFVAERPVEGQAGQLRAASADELTAFQLQLEGGAYAQGLVSVAAQPGVLNEFVLLGTAGTLRLLDQRLVLTDAAGTTQDATPPPTLSIPEGLSGPFPVASVYLAHALRAALEQNSCDPLLVGASFEDGLKVQQALDAIRASARQGGGWVVL
jgi:predicted dehydrogenase